MASPACGGSSSPSPAGYGPSENAVQEDGWRIMDSGAPVKILGEKLPLEAWTVPAAIQRASELVGPTAIAVTVVSGARGGSEPPTDMTYGQLLQRVRKAAGALRTFVREHGWNAEDTDGDAAGAVGLCVDEALPLLVAMLGVLWSGFSFVPVDLGHWPVPRCAGVLRALGPSLCCLLAEERQKKAVADVCVQLSPQPPVAMLEALGETPQGGVEEMIPAPRPEDLCYTIFTSGSTGVPKGVMCEHHMALLYALGKAQEEEVRPGSRLLLGSHFTFDPCQGDVFGALSIGATLVVAPRAQVLGDLQGVLRGCEVTHATMTPTQWGLRAGGELPALRHLTLLGEPMRAETIDVWAERLSLRNMYGVTEATGAQTFHKLAKQDSTRIAGRALPGFVVGLGDSNEDDDKQADRSAQEGRRGEVVMGGAGIARGYLGQPEETAQRFRPSQQLGGSRVYFTGDLGRWGTKGLELLGRVDHQVKLSGVRVELSEIEAVLLAGSASRLVAAAVCVVVAGSLYAHLQLQRAEQELDWVLRAALEAACEARLPRQVVPHRFVTHKALPLAPGGKVDRQALERQSRESAAVETAETKAPFVPLETALEKAVAEAWAVARLSFVGHADPQPPEQV
eukprot:TRINITY_DN16865_c0_g1_i3.p1 TRINITY_DN16865_c0_g1~~TRINITY_DN16865_c0_g1_i3.p1  ORF type:complete len:623 (-),score=149.36 TRINITY_DN16865_c0_g1_i3:1654-3522(-)